MAENSLGIALAGMLWAFEIRPPISDDGITEGKMDLSEKAYPNPGFTTPGPFKARFVIRDEERERIVTEQWEVAMKEGYELRGVPVDVNGVVRY